MSLASQSIRHGYVLGAGAAINVSIGFIPKRVDVFNLTDGTVAAIGFPGKLIPFNTAGPAVPTIGMKILGATSGAIAKVKDIILVTGTYAASSGAGFFVCDVEDVNGTFQAENVSYSTSATVIADSAVTVPVEDTLYQSAALGFVSGTGNTGILSYVGTSALAKGFTIGSTIAVTAKRLRWTAYRD